jgi:DNA-directed RNA polymerase subunit alpha
MELSVRSANCLRAADIRTIGDLVQKPESMMLKYRNFGRKSLKEISDILSEMGLGFGMDVTPYLGKGAVLPATLPPPELLKGEFDDDDDDDDDMDDFDLDEDDDDEEAVEAPAVTPAPRIEDSTPVVVTDEDDDAPLSDDEDKD